MGALKMKNVENGIFYDANNLNLSKMTLKNFDPQLLDSRNI
jgi:hypothetical protein